MLDTKPHIERAIRDLAPLPLVVQKLLKVMSDDNNSADDLARVLSLDHALTSRILKLVNSSFYGHSGNIGTISHAIVVLGHVTIRNLALGLPIFDIVRNSLGEEYYLRFWRHSLIVAMLCRELSDYLEQGKGEEAFVAGLLHDIGQIAFGVAMPESYRELMDRQGDEDYLDLEKATFDIDHTSAGRLIMEKWRLPISLCDVAEHHHSGKILLGPDKPLVSLVSVADQMARVHGAHGRVKTNSELFFRLNARLEIDFEGHEQILRNIDQQASDLHGFLIAHEELPLIVRPVTDLSLRVAVFSNVESHRIWVESLVRYFGQQTIPMEDWIREPDDQDDVDLVMLDTSGLTPARTRQLHSLLEERDAGVVQLDTGRPGDIAAEDVGFPRLPMLFDWSDLAPHLRLRARS